MLNNYFFKYLLGDVMKGFTKLGRTLLALTVLFILPLSDAMSQKFIMNEASATYNATCGGVIKLNSVSAVPAETAEIVRINNPLGTDAGNAINGIVDWAGASATQVVQGLFYEKLMLSGDAGKDIADGVNIVGEVCDVNDLLFGYTDFATYPFFITAGQIATDLNNFEGTFNYIGAVQSIFPVTGANAYNNLAMNNAAGVYTMPTETITSVTGTIALNSASTLDVDGELNTGLESTFAGAVTIAGTVDDPAEINVGAEAITFAGALDVTDYSTLNTGAGGIITTGATLIDGTTALINVEAGNVEFNEDLTITEGTLFAGDAAVAGDIGTVTIGADNDATIGALGELDFGTNTFLEITGTIANGGDGTNLAFDCLSTVTYNGPAGQLVMPTVSTNTYGNLILDNGDKTMLTAASTSGYDVYLCGDFTLNGGGNFDIFKADANPGTLFMTDASKTASYAGLEEVVGTFNRVTDGTGRTYTLNNALTEVTLATDAANPTNIQTLVLPGTAPEQYDGSTDVNRKITFSYTGNADVADDEFEYDMKVGYLLAEGPNAGAWGGLTTQTSLRMYEANAADKEKVGTGNTPVKTAASTGPDVMGSFSITGIKSALSTNTVLPNGIGLFASTNDVLLTAGPTTFYSINDGRWTNPNTWDEGTLPTEDDNALIRHHVYAGIAGPFVGTDAPGNTTPEDVEYAGDVPAAFTIEVADIAGAAFILGNEDNGDGYVFRTKSTAGTTFMNNNTNPNAVAFGTGIAAKATYENTVQPFNGVWITNYGTTATRSSILKSNQISNTGTFNNEGVVEIGE